MGILNGLGIFEDGEESEEEKRQREAQNTGSAIGAAVGLAIGATTALHDSDNQTDQTPNDPDDGQGFDFIM